MAVPGPVAAFGGIMDVPFADIKTILDMVTGKTPFDLKTAVAALSAIVDYLATLNPPAGQTALVGPLAAPRNAQLASMLHAQLLLMAPANSPNHQALMQSGFIDLIPQKVIWEFIIKQLLTWIAEQQAAA